MAMATYQSSEHMSRNCTGTYQEFHKYVKHIAVLQAGVLPIMKLNIYGYASSNYM